MWQPMETAPRDGSVFIVWSPAGVTSSGCAYGQGVDLCEFDLDMDDFIKHGCGFAYATHWMPLEPPA